MNKTVTALLAAATIAGTLAVSTTDADAQRWRRGWWGPGIAAGFVTGALIGTALARPRYYGPPAVIVEPGPACYLTRGRPVWNGFRWIRPTVEVCD
jgi:hypothetical protein